MEDTNEARSQTPQSSRLAALQQKRTRYTPIACDECKRRKIKCDGQTPCHRCARQSTTCIYTQRGNNVTTRQDIEWEKMKQKMSVLQEQIDLLTSNAASAVLPLPQQAHITSTITPPAEETDALQTSNSKPNDGNPHARRRSRVARHPQYMGPTSSAYSFGVARRSLQEMGIQQGTDLSDGAVTSYSTTPARSRAPSHNLSYTVDPLLQLSESEASRLVETYEEECGTLYPFIDIVTLLDTVQQFYRSAISTLASPTTRGSGDANICSGGMLDILKLVVAIALVIESHGPTKLSLTLLENVESGFNGRLCGPCVDTLEIQAWTLMSILQFHCDEEALAWRTIGLAARAALELGLHRRDTYSTKFSSPQPRLWANKLFWCIYVLDRRWSFGTGLPFALNDDDIDPGLPEQSDSDSGMLRAMIGYGQIGSKIWKVTSNLNASPTAETLAFLDFQVLQWEKSIVPELRLHPDNEDMLEGYSRTKNRLRVLFYLRGNQMRLFVFRRALLSSQTINDDISSAHQAVHIARETVRVLDTLNRTSDIYSSQQTCFNYFLVSALAAILLAVCHAPGQFNESCRTEFYMALDLLRVFSAKSYVARKLWKTVKHLKVIGPKLGVLPTQEQHWGRQIHSRGNDPSQSSPTSSLSAIVPEPISNFDCSINMNPQSGSSSTCSFPLDGGNRLSDDLTSIFEAFESTYGQLPIQNSDNQRFFDPHNYGPADDFSRSLMDLF